MCEANAMTSPHTLEMPDIRLVCRRGASSADSASESADGVSESADTTFCVRVCSHMSLVCRHVDLICSVQTSTGRSESAETGLSLQIQPVCRLRPTYIPITILRKQPLSLSRAFLDQAACAARSSRPSESLAFSGQLHCVLACCAS